ncbi:MAG: hypothetical protein H6906_02325 [Hyphomicrobiales bacterium]|nr:hypothetical protein [Hyphomicrobiales bacterium]
MAEADRESDLIRGIYAFVTEPESGDGWLDLWQAEADRRAAAGLPPVGPRLAEHLARVGGLLERLQSGATAVPPPGRDAVEFGLDPGGPAGRHQRRGGGHPGPPPPPPPTRHAAPTVDDLPFDAATRGRLRRLAAQAGAEPAAPALAPAARRPRRRRGAGGAVRARRRGRRAAAPPP